MRAKLKSVTLLIVQATILACREPESRAARSPDCGVTSRTVVSGSGIGALRIGDQVDSVATRCQVVADTTWWDEEYPQRQRVLLVRLGADTVAALVDDDRRIRRISVGRNRFATSDSLRVGTRLVALLKLPGIRGGVGETTTWVTAPEHCGISFLISDAGRFEHGDNLTRANLATLPDTTHVVALQLEGGDCSGNSTGRGF